ncbi:helix-turn-helix domain-containing protein (plasmid) [Streptomyces canus]|uniref:hypothetical protein n=1 Tax=Streptomyces canus TaxID=58343 RepID=UPI002F91ACC9|nr:helix-turn-helix domain-containing protein [Streptomyces canus]
MNDEDPNRNLALTELRRRLEAGRTRMRLNKTDLAGRAGLGRTTVSEAFQIGGPAPSVQTVTALAGALRLPVEELQELQRAAAGSGTNEAPSLGRPIGQWDPHALEVHPAGIAQDGSGSPRQQILPGYVVREHDRLLAEVVREAQQGHSEILILAGGSSTGKTRACWEAVQPLADHEWRLWHPFDPTRAEAALEDLHRVGPRTVVWLNEAHHYLGHTTAGERVAAAVHHLLISPQRGPILVLGTLWPEYVKQFTALPAAGSSDPHSRVRELLTGRIVNVPDAFDAGALAAATLLAEDGDRLLADALTRSRLDGCLTQDLAGGPALLERYRNGSPAARALLHAAMDARRLGVGLHLPQAFLTDAAIDYVHDTDWNQFTDDWAEQAYAGLAEQVHGKQAPLSRVNPRPQRCPPGHSASADGPSAGLVGPVFRLADYLEQYGRTSRRHLCPPGSFWDAAHTHLTRPDDLDHLTLEASKRHRLQWAHHLRLRAADRGSTDALNYLTEGRKRAGDYQGAEALYWQAYRHGDVYALLHMTEMWESAGDHQGAVALAWEIVDYGHTHALTHLAEMREKVGDHQSAEALYRQAADHGDTRALCGLARMREIAADREDAEALYLQAFAYGNFVAVDDAACSLTEMREKAGDHQGAEALAQQAADHGHASALVRLAEMRAEAGDYQSAETLARQAADRGDTHGLTQLGEMLEGAGNYRAAESFYRQAADHGDRGALYLLSGTRRQAGDVQGADALWRQAVLADGYNNAAIMWDLALLREEAGDHQGAEALFRQAADHGYSHASMRLAKAQEEVGDYQGAEALYRQAADQGEADAFIRLAEIKEEAGGYQDAHVLYRQAADAGISLWTRGHDVFRRLWPHGLDPDGTPTPRWR